MYTSLPVSFLVKINTDGNSYDDERKPDDEKPSKRSEPAPSPDYQPGVASVERSMAGFQTFCKTIGTL